MRISDWSSDVCSSDLVAANPLLRLDDLLDPLQEPGIVFGDGVDLGDGEALAQRLGRDQQPVRRRPGERGLDLDLGRPLERLDDIHPANPSLHDPPHLLPTPPTYRAAPHHPAHTLPPTQ